MSALSPDVGVDPLASVLDALTRSGRVERARGVTVAFQVAQPGQSQLKHTKLGLSVVTPKETPKWLTQSKPKRPHAGVETRAERKPVRSAAAQTGIRAL